MKKSFMRKGLAGAVAFAMALSLSVTAPVVSADAKGAIKNQTQLTKALEAGKSKTIKINTKKAEDFYGSLGTYDGTKLVVSAKKSTMSNIGDFDGIVLKKINTYTEKSSKLNDIDVKNVKTVVIDKASKVNTLTFSKANGKTNLQLDGKVSEIIVSGAGADVTIDGACMDTVKVTVLPSAKGAKITSSLKMNVDVQADASVVLKEGADYSVITEANGVKADVKGTELYNQLQELLAEAVIPADAEVNTYAVNSENVKIMGRSTTIDDVVWTSLSATGIEFNYESASYVKVTLVGDTSAKNKDVNNEARYAIAVNGLIYKTELVSEETQDVIINTASAPSGVIRIAKCSESENSSMGFKSIVTDGKISPTAKKDLNIQFIGDSITCGYGVDGTSADKFCSLTENATKTYAYKTAEALDADFTFVSFSGYGIISGYTNNDEKNEISLISNVYDKLGKPWGNMIPGGINVSTIDWDFSNDDFDYVVINLGQNDSSYTKGKADRIAEFEEGYKAFLKTVREKNPNATIICCLGTMGQDLCNAIEKASGEFATETGDTKVKYLKLDIQNTTADGVGVDWHPSEISHQKAADKLIEFIKGL